MKEIGENNILTNPYRGYTEYLSGPFPSGLVENVSLICKVSMVDEFIFFSNS